MNKSSSDDILDNIHGYYHVKVVLSDKEELYEFDLTENHLTENIVNPYKSGRPFYFSGKFVDPFIINIQISLTKKSLGRFSLLVDEIRLFHDEEYILRTGTSRSYVLQQFQAFSRLKQDLRKNDVTTKFIQSPPIKGQATEVNHRSESKSVSAAASDRKLMNDMSYDPKKIFIVHGHDDASKNELASFLWRIGLEPIILHEQPKGGRVIIEQFERYAADVGYAFVLLTPDDFGGDNANIKVIQPRARQNVILEMGYFMGKLKRDRICCLAKGEVEPPSDMHGILLLKYNQKVEEQFYGITTELHNAGYNVKH